MKKSIFTLFLMPAMLLLAIQTFAVEPPCGNCSKDPTNPATSTSFDGSVKIFFPVCANSITLDIETAPGVYTTIGMVSVSGPGDYTFTGLGEGHYRYEVTGDNVSGNCSSNFNLHAQNQCNVQASSTAPPILCHGGTTVVTVTASGGTAPYDGAGEATVTAGSYDFLVTDAVGCTAITHIDISEPAQLVASVSSSPILCFEGRSTVTVTATGGTGAYTGTGEYTVPAGAYDYTVTDANGCSSTVHIDISEPTQLLASVTATPILCYGGTSTVTVGATGGTGLYTGTGEFTVYAGGYDYTVTDENGCSSSVHIDVDQPSLLVASSSGVDASCFGFSDGEAQVSATGGTPPYSGTGVFSNLAADTYTYTVTDANGCEASTTVVINQPAALTLEVSANNGTCWGGGTVTATVTGGTEPYSYSWSNNSATSSITVVPGSYTVTISDAHGCPSLSAGATVENPPVCTGKTYSKGAYSASCSGGNAGCYLNTNFPLKYPNATCLNGGGLVIGGAARSVRLTSAAAVRTYLSASGNGTPGALALGAACNPSGTSNTLATQTVATTLNVAFFGIGVQYYGFAPAWGKTVNEILAEANNMLNGGNSWGLTFSQMTTVLDNINKNYENGANLGKLFCACTAGKVAEREEGDAPVFVTNDENVLVGYPNPFNQQTTLKFSLPDEQPVTLGIYNATGMLVATPFKGNVVADEQYSVVFEGENLASGIYFCKLSTSNKTYIRKLLLIK